MNNREVYDSIQQRKYKWIDAKRVWDAVEELVASFFQGKKITSLQTKDAFFGDWYASYADLTMRAVHTSNEIIAQPWFLVWECFCISDFLVKNSQWKREAVEVKSKRSVRKGNGELIYRLLVDVSFQHYLLQHALWDWYAGKIHLVYLNKHFAKQSSDDLDASVLCREEVWQECRSASCIEQQLLLMKKDLSRSEQAFDERFPYQWEDYFSYYGKEPPKDSIWSLPGVSSRALVSLQEQWVWLLAEIDETIQQSLVEEQLFKSRQTKYLTYWRTWEQEVRETERIHEWLQSLKYPLFCYDYEALSRPLPRLPHTSPRESVVLQYSLHVVQADGQVDHYQWLIDEATDFAHATFVEQLLSDMQHGAGGTYLVWWKGFELSRNKEMWRLYDAYTPSFHRINVKTTDAMNIFSSYAYFSRALKWSASLKDVMEHILPGSYTNLAIWDGAEAAMYLQEYLFSDLNPIQKLTLQQQLFDYCGMDSLALVEIVKFLTYHVSSNHSHITT